MCEASDGISMDIEGRGVGGSDSLVPYGALAEGRAILVRGPAMTGKYDLVLRLLAAVERAILVSTSDAAERLRADFAAYGDPDALAVVDCTTRLQGDTREEDDDTRYAASPQNLTEVGVKFTDLVDSVREDDSEQVAVGVHSLSALLMYWEVERVFQFVRVLLNQVQGFGWGAVAVLDDAATDEQTVSTLTQPFDAVIETRMGDDGREFRTQGLGDGPSDWTAF